LVEGPTTSKPKSTVSGSTDASNGDTDTEDFTSTQERLIQEADPESLDRTFRANKQHFRIGGAISSPSPFPLQTLPRLAYVINYNVVYNEDRERWEPQKKSDPRGAFDVVFETTVTIANDSIAIVKTGLTDPNQEGDIYLPVVGLTNDDGANFVQLIWNLTSIEGFQTNFDFAWDPSEGEWVVQIANGEDEAHDYKVVVLRITL